MNSTEPPETLKDLRKQLMQVYPEKYPNPHLVPTIEKVVVHCCVGEAGEELENAEKILKDLTGRQPALLRAKKTVQGFGIHKGQPIGWKITLRGNEAFSFLKRVLEVYDKTVWKGNIDERGNLSFGVEEHQEIPGAEYDPELGIIGFDVNIALARPGYRVKKRKERAQSIPKRHKVEKEDAVLFFKTLGTVREGRRQKTFV